MDTCRRCIASVMGTWHTIYTHSCSVPSIGCCSDQSNLRSVHKFHIIFCVMAKLKLQREQKFVVTMWCLSCISRCRKPLCMYFRWIIGHKTTSVHSFCYTYNEKSKFKIARGQSHALLYHCMVQYNYFLCWNLPLL